MDPKMDSGCVPPGDTLEPDFDVCRGLAAGEVIWIMDQLLCLSAIWHDGYPISQTVFMSLHVDRLLSPDNRSPYTLLYGDKPPDKQTLEEALTHTVLRAFCVALVKCCAQVLHVVQSQMFFEEEDFVTHLFGRELLSRCSADDAIRMLDNARSWLSEATIADDTKAALEARLQFVRTYLALLLNDLNDWSDLIGILETVAHSHNLATAIPEAFSEKVQRQLATSTPPRPMLEMSWQEAHEKWTKMCAEISEAERLTSFHVCHSPHGLQRALWAFAYREPQPNIFARAYIQNILFGSDRITEDMTLFDLFLTDFRDLVLAGDPLADPESFQVEMPSDPRHRCSRIMEVFMDRAFDEYLNLYRMVCQNRCRIRRSCTQSIALLDGLESEAMRTDAELSQIVRPTTLHDERHGETTLSPLTSWVRFQKLQIMAWTVQLGFETDIYLPDELCMMYWLLSVLTHRRCKLLEHIERFLVEDRMKALNKTRNTRYIADCLTSQDWLRSLHAQANVQRLLALALWRLTNLLMAVNVIRPPKRDYAQERLLWDARMKPYLCVSNDPIPALEDFKQATTGTVEKTCRSVEMDIKDAKAQLSELKQMTPDQAKYVGTEEEWKKEIKRLETTCVAIAVQSSQLLRVCAKHGRTSAGVGDELGDIVSISIPPPGSRYHAWWAVPQIKENATA